MDHEKNSVEDTPSRSQQRREALAVLELAQQLVELPATRLERIDLPDEVREEIIATRRISAHGARKRQLAYLAKLMRRHDDDEFAAARAALGEDRARQRRDAAALHRIEALRLKLIEGGDAALSELITAHPDIERQPLRNLIRQARNEHEADKPARAFRELFRLLRELESNDESD